jgi:hypothetical protein
LPGEFTDHQWQRLAEAGPQIARAVAASAGRASQSEAELDAVLRLVDQTADESDGAGLLGALAAATRDKIAAGMLTQDPQNAIPDGIQAAREAGAILGVAADEQQARAIRQWLLQIAHTVAGAAREGGLFGIGGKQVSDLERETMADIADGLGASLEESSSNDNGAGAEADGAQDAATASEENRENGSDAEE